MIESIRPMECVTCGKVVAMASATTSDPEAPEMISGPCAPGGTWIGFVHGDHAPEMIVCCSRSCVEVLLSA